MTKIWVDPNWYPPVYEESHGHISVRMGDHVLVDGETLHLQWPDETYEDAKVKLIERRNAALDVYGRVEEIITAEPFLKIKLHGVFILISLKQGANGIQLRRGGGKLK